ncbi:MAG: M15 family metallopeptidase [Cyanobacteria bacterium J06621_11]
MKQFNRLPGWLKFVVMTVLAACVVINAIALTEIVSSLRARSDTYSQSPSPPAPTVSVQNTRAATGIFTPSSPSSTETPIETSIPANAEPAAETAPVPIADQTPKYGHFPYPEGDATSMTLVASYSEGNIQRAETLHADAAQALLEMVAAARVEGIWLVPASGYRTIAQQRTLFSAQIAKKGSPEEAATVSAPPGYSEHHTGYAIDLTDGTLPQTQDISDAFAETAAYQWLVANASTYGFELSFPEDNEQGIAFEPWHWRYVGTAEAQALFRAATGATADTVDLRNAPDTPVE